jgi:hypothetical protein
MMGISFNMLNSHKFFDPKYFTTNVITKLFFGNNHKPLWQNHRITHKAERPKIEEAREEAIHICFWQNDNGNRNNCYFQAEVISCKKEYDDVKIRASRVVRAITE